MTAALERAGFDLPRMAYAGRTAIAACLAFLAAWALGLEHPQWAGMTVWAASQPLRGQLLEKSLFRILGTVAGTGAGIALVLAMTVHPALLVLGLALWVGLCTCAGNLLRGFTAYGTVLAGYTAAMVSLLDTAHPDRVLLLGADRMATVLTGVLVAAAVGMAFAPKADGRALRRQLEELLADLLDHVAGREAPAEAERELMARLAALDESLEPQSAGQRGARQQVRGMRAAMLAAMSLLFWRHGEGQAPAGAPAAASAALRRGDPASAARALDAHAANQAEGAELRERLAALSLALGSLDRPGTAEPGRPAPAVPLHRDWPGGREAGLRAAGAILLFGALWQVTGWHAGAFLLLGLSVMLSLFSTFENPAGMMKNVWRGQLLGVLGALACRWLAWPLAENELQMILLTLPFILIGPLFVGHRRTVMMSFDYNMVMLLLLQPHWPLTGSFGASVGAGLAVVAAPFAAMAAYRWVYPPTLRRRSAALVRAMLRNIEALAADPQGAGHADIWRARLYHRSLRLTGMGRASRPAQIAALETGAGLLDLSQAVLRCHAMAAEAAGGPSLRRAAGLALARSRRLSADPAAAERAFSALSRRLGPGGGHLMERAAAAVRKLRGAGLLESAPAAAA
ncbi:FUSC family protein [Poseidonocella sp. HB161398]|uniref:FUSC family protein n=1 Tax=Poseidonocella sp. HB161398 TaxID=2320855 RepID=UPI001107BFC8|nr:FUSC family protein [Poseidonocella sp. HB161398]